MPTHKELAIATEQELDLTLVAPEDRGIKLYVTLRELKDDGTTGDAVGRVAERFVVRGALPVPTMTAFLRLETRINNALAADEETADRELEQAMQEAHDRIVDLISERRPSALDPREHTHDERTYQVRPVLELDTGQILATLSWLAGDVSVADAVARALTSGRSGAVEAPEDGAAADAAGVEAAASAPFDSA